eukprot:symbB.v1.2.009969.t1/scaffold623.1/size335370/12
MAQAILKVATILLVPAESLIRELYTTNAACRSQYCVNPVYPGLQDMPGLEKKRWAKMSLPKIAESMEFCNGTVNYNVALPMESTESDNMTILQERVRAQDQQAAEAYFLHLSAMGIEPWDHVKPFEESSSRMRPCARAVARMACFTYLPDAIHNIQDGAEVRYHRPCDTGCESFLQTCGVECCDESTVCVWSAPVTATLPEFQVANPGSIVGDADCCPKKENGTLVTQETLDSKPRHTEDAQGHDVILFQGYAKASEGLCTGRSP